MTADIIIDTSSADIIIDTSSADIIIDTSSDINSDSTDTDTSDQQHNNNFHIVPTSPTTQPQNLFFHNYNINTSKSSASKRSTDNNILATSAPPSLSFIPEN